MTRELLGLVASFAVVTAIAAGCSHTDVKQGKRGIASVDASPSPEPSGTPTEGLSRDLIVDPNSYTPEKLAEIKAKLAELSSRSVEDVPTAKLRVPDFPIAYERLETLTSRALFHYLESMERINYKVKTFLSRVKALEELKSASPDLYKKYATQFMKVEIPKVNAEINRIYADAIRELYLLEKGAIALPVGKKDMLYQHGARTTSNTLIGICETALCADRMKEEIYKYWAFVDRVNQDVDFTKLPEKKGLNLGVPLPNAGLASGSVFHAADKMIEIGLTKNKEYTVWSAASAYVGDMIESGSGLVVAFVGAPIFVFEQVANFARYLDWKFMITEMKLHALDVRSMAKVKASIEKEMARYNKNRTPFAFETAHQGELRRITEGARSRAEQFFYERGDETWNTRTRRNRSEDHSSSSAPKPSGVTSTTGTVASDNSTYTDFSDRTREYVTDSGRKISFRIGQDIEIPAYPGSNRKGRIKTFNTDGTLTVTKGTNHSEDTIDHQSIKGFSRTYTVNGVQAELVVGEILLTSKYPGEKGWLVWAATTGVKWKRATTSEIVDLQASEITGAQR